MQTEIMKVTGMTCGGCTSNVTNALTAVAGVGDVSVSLATGEATVRYDERKATPTQLKGAVTAAGYGVGATDVTAGGTAKKGCCGLPMFTRTRTRGVRVIDDPRIKGVALTGSAEAGKIVAGRAGENLKKSTMELGGSDAFIVLDDADLDKAVWGKMNSTGQCCVAAKRFIVVESLVVAPPEAEVPPCSSVACGLRWSHTAFSRSSRPPCRSSSLATRWRKAPRWRRCRPRLRW